MEDIESRPQPKRRARATAPKPGTAKYQTWGGDPVAADPVAADDPDCDISAAAKERKTQLLELQAELQAKNAQLDDLEREARGLRAKLQEREKELTAATKDADELRRRLEGMEEDRASIQAQLSFVSGALDVSDAKVEAYERILQSARLVPSDRLEV